ncbi:hypothetical protein BDW67DRAFT_191537 [Aspergillus spinulosporus]
MTSLTRDDYTIAWICALPLEMAAARVMLDRIHSPLPIPSADPNAYEVGEIDGHYIVISCLPIGVYGTVSAAAVVSRTRLTFPRLQYGLMVGIGGGVPGKNIDIRLGDVVVSKPVGKYRVQGGIFEPTGTLNKPPHAFLTPMGQLEAKQMTEGNAALSKIVREALEQNPEITERFAPPEQHTDRLFHSSYYHTTREDICQKCDNKELIKRQPRETRTPYIHYGLIASGDQLMKDPETRDRLAQQHGILCFEMEAGMADNKIAYSPDYNKRNPRFVGRQDEILKLEELLTTQDGPKRIAITGLGGVGKTQLALEVAYRIRYQDKKCSVFWVPCTSHAMIEQTFLNLARMLGLHGVKPAEVKEQVKLYLSSESAGKWLLIFDNADDTEMWLTADRTSSALEDVLPQSQQGRILFTTLNGELAASAYINKKRLGMSLYLALLQQEEKDAVELLSEDFKDPGRYNDTQNPVITTWLISFKQIQQQNQLAADYLSFMACLSPRNIPLSLLPPPSTDKQKLDALGLLNAYSFTHSQDTQISMHRLVRIATRNWLRKHRLFCLWIQRVADRLGELFPDSSHYNRELWREYLPPALVLVHEKEFILQLREYMEFVERISDCLASDGRYSEAEVLYIQLMRVNHEERGSEHPSTLTNMANLASTYFNQGHGDIEDSAGS